MLMCFQEKQRNCVISDFLREIDEKCAPLGYYAASSSKFLPTFRDNLSVPSSWVKNSKGFWILDPWKVGPVGCSETSVKICYYPMRNNPRKTQLSKREGVNILDRRNSSLVKSHVGHKRTAVIGRQSSVSFHLSMLKMLKTAACTGFVCKY